MDDQEVDDAGTQRAVVVEKVCRHLATPGFDLVVQIQKEAEIPCQLSPEGRAAIAPDRAERMKTTRGFGCGVCAARLIWR
ncbi:hypothetical protein GCM10011335_26380 [Aureimonas glaciei]|uniref:Uncharacterized protein n=1 Tax=Aureimonas glaciei TaxID=1776957 RepID=A0A916XZ07_9HYPH|nr:hypothetical protein GCM10011335_26380 [Aureimonas glaciei]